MAHLALYREFRPQRFADVVGQQHITRTLKNALVHNRMHHAYLLSGPRGTGKTTVARLLAKAVNCLNPQDGEPCNQCSACRSIMSGETMDVIEIDAASNRGIDEIRDLREKVNYAPADLKYKVYIIDEVHMLTEPAFNALLKTLEEPPKHVLFVLATTEKQKLPITILSRCQSFEYHRLSTEEITSQLQEVCGKYSLEAADSALAAIARQAEGGMRDALSLLDQVMAYAEDGKITLDDTLDVLGSAPLEEFLKLDQCMGQGDVGGGLTLLDELARKGKDLRQFVRDYLAHMRDLLLLKVDSTGRTLDLPSHMVESMKGQAAEFEQEQILVGIRLFAQLENDLRYTSSPRLLVEVGLIRLAGVYSGQISPGAEPAPVPQPAVQSNSRKIRRAPAAPVSPATPVAQENEPETVVADQAPPVSPTVAELPAVPRGEGADVITQVWDQVLDLVKRARPSTFTLLKQARVARLRGQTLILVAPNAPFADLLKRPGDKAILEKALEKVGLNGITVQPVGPEDAAAKALSEQDQPQKAAPQRDEQSLLEVALKVFPKELVHEIKEDDSK